MKILFLLLMSTSLRAEQIYSDGMSCLYTRENGTEVFKENFTINKSGPSVSLKKRGFSMTALVEEDSFKVEFLEGVQRKVVGQSVKNVWSLKRKPLELKASTKIAKINVEVVCR